MGTERSGQALLLELPAEHARVQEAVHGIIFLGESTSAYMYRNEVHC